MLLSVLKCSNFPLILQIATDKIDMISVNLRNLRET